MGEVHCTMDVVMVDEGKQAPALLPWVEKYRPSSLDQLVAHEDIIRMIEPPAMQRVDTASENDHKESSGFECWNLLHFQEHVSGM